MNTANLQIEGLLLALTALVSALKQRGALDASQVEKALADAETAFARDRHRSETISPANLNAILFPIRFLREANGRADALSSFAEIAATVAETKDPGRAGRARA